MGGFQGNIVLALLVAWIIVYLVLIRGVETFGKVRMMLAVWYQYSILKDVLRFVQYRTQCCICLCVSALLLFWLKLYVYLTACNNCCVTGRVLHCNLPIPHPGGVTGSSYNSARLHRWHFLLSHSTMG